MTDTVAFCLMFIVVVTMLHFQFRPMFMDKRQFLIVAFMDTFVAVSLGVATDTLITNIFK